MKIYIVELHDYDGDISIGYFSDRKKADECCEYLNKAQPSDYKDYEWKVIEYEPNLVDYATMIKEFDGWDFYLYNLKDFKSFIGE